MSSLNLWEAFFSFLDWILKRQSPRYQLRAVALKYLYKQLFCVTIY